jgi:PhnB protein
MTMPSDKNVFFAPVLYIKPGTRDISFYEKAFDAVIVQCWKNDDNSIHAAELSIDGALFHLHEDSPRKKLLNPGVNKSSSVAIGLFVTDVDAVMKKAILSGAEEISPAKDYEYGYRQGDLEDPFGHSWTIQKKIP